MTPLIIRVYPQDIYQFVLYTSGATKSAKDGRRLQEACRHFV
jgi:hypothetical protein